MLSWATGLILSPSVILGTALFVLSLVLFAISTRLSPRGGRRAPDSKAVPGSPRPAVTNGEAARGRPAVGDGDLEDIEALLRKHGIS
jgi:hypothetical protein